MRLHHWFASGSAALLLGLAGTASALPPCPTWFPDFRGCGRHGRYDGFVPPMMHPYLFEDPFITTGVSAWGVWHEFPDDSILQGGRHAPDDITSQGDLWLAAVQARVAITDRVALIATKDGWVDFNPGLELIDDDRGFTDLTAAAIDDRENNFILSPSLRYQVDVGDHGLLQGNGDGVFIPDISLAWGIEKFHLIFDLGGQFPIDTNAQSTAFFSHLHLDYAVLPFLVPFFEIGGFHYIDGGDGSTRVKLTNRTCNALGAGSGCHIPLGAAQALFGTDPEEGYDYANIGSQGVAGETVAAWSVGIRFPVNRHLIFGIAYERPLTDNRDVLEQRASVNATLEF
jgi:hypothetical protein